MVFAIAWRNVLRNFRRSLITVLSITIGLLALLFLWGAVDGQYNGAIENYRLRYVGSIQIHKEGFFRRPKLETHITNPEAVLNVVREIGVDAWTTRLNSFALVAGEENATGMNLVGIDPETEGAVSLLDDNIIRGRFLTTSDEYAALIGLRAAEKLDVDVGHEIVMLSNDRRGAMTADRFEIVGLVVTGQPGVDDMSVFVPLEDAQTMLAMEGRITDVVAQVPERDLDNKVLALGNALGGQDLEILRWFDISSLVKDAQTLDRAFSWIFVGIVVGIVISGIANTVLFSMMQRTREFGILLALGTQRATVGMMIALETMILGVTGTVLGTVLGLGLVKGVSINGIDMLALAGEGDGMAEVLSQFAMNPILRPEVNLEHLLVTIGLMLLASAVSYTHLTLPTKA